MSIGRLILFYANIQVFIHSFIQIHRYPIIIILISYKALQMSIDIQILKLLTSTTLRQFNSIIFIRDREIVNLLYILHDI